jgi:hypothetical protein
LCRICAFGGQRDLVRPGALDQPLASQRVPHILIFQARRVAAAHGGIAQVKVIAMGMGKGGDGGVALGRELGSIGNLRDGLQQGEGAQLKRIEFGGIDFGRHDGPDKEKRPGPYRPGRFLAKASI